MQIRIIPQIGDQFLIDTSESSFGFAYTNKHGGTNLSNSHHNEPYEGPKPVVTITKVWYDEECGYRCWASPVTKELVDYLTKYGKTPDKLFVSEFALLQITDPGFKPDEDSLIATIETAYTGGNIYNDVITLKDGTIIRISDGAIGVYKNQEDDDNGEAIVLTYY